MKQLSVILVMLFSVISLMAQENKTYTMKVWSNGSFTSYSVEKVDSVTFATDDNNTGPDSSTTEDSFNQNENSIKSVLAGAYVKFQTFLTSEKKMEELALDETADSYYHITPYNTIVNQAWVDGYTAISLCNSLIEVLEQKDYPFETDKYNMHAKALRAIIYYMMAQMWGDIPYVQSTSMDEAYDPKIAQQQEIINDSYYFFKFNAEQIPEIFDAPTKALNMYNLQPLVNEMAMYIDGKPYKNCNAENSLILNLDNSDDTYIVVDATYNELLDKEYNQMSTPEELAKTWKDARPRYGVWSALKRLNSVY